MKGEKTVYKEMYLILYQVVGSKEVILLFFSFSYFSFSAPGNHHMAITGQRLPFVHKLQACCSGIDQQSESWQKKTVQQIRGTFIGTPQIL